ncbi:MAG: glucoamylase family protein, partial [Pseudomonadota bacterium]|nr:glucoamylase family protein [Pseudomonadota bacterium]
MLHFRAPASPWNTNTIIREELFSITRLEQHAESLAQSQPVTAKPPQRRSLNERLGDNDAVLLAAYRTITRTVTEGGNITPAAEWLLDNYHVIEEQIRKIHSDLPPSFYRQLPKLAEGPFTGYPRVFGMAWACVAHSDSRFDLNALLRFVRAYQVVQPLTIGELWAMAITMRIVLIENLRRAAELIVNSRVEREQADRVSDRLLGVNGLAIDQQALFRHYEKHGALSTAFVVQVVKRLRDQDPRVTPALLWLEEQLVAQGTSSDEMVYGEHQLQGATNVTVRNIITSMRLISDVNWAEFFEAVSLVETALCEHTDLAQMDFATRNLYRSAIEDLSRRCPLSELEVTHAVIAATRADACDDQRARDPGYHLVGRGRRAFEKVVGYRPPLSRWPRALNEAVGPIGYIAAVIVLAAGIVAAPIAVLATLGIQAWHLAACALLGMIPAIDVSVAVVNRAVTRGFGATMLPGLSLRHGIPADMRTMIVVPALLTTRAAIEAMLERLEVHYLASTHGELHLALLLDWTDAASERTDDDQALLQIATDGIAELNRIHDAPSQGARFYALHRRRVWSDSEQQWMGWERKRGKLHELNQLLRGASDTTFIASADLPPLPSDVRYVITLDADTRLPREAVRRLVGKLAHPLNHARFDATTGRVVEGYAVLQPRVTPSLPIGREGSTFQRTFSSMTGIDSYGAAVSDVYQDLFGEGSYAGKGIYDIDAFESALANRVPASSLLSHDLFEGTFARAALVSDIEVIEEFPARYDVSAARNHRWSRGDWQLLPWMLGRKDVARRGSGALPLLAQWKMLDNLRRTLSAPASLCALLTGWLLPLNAALVWTAFVVATIALPALLPVLAAAVPRRGVMVRSHLAAWSQDLTLACAQIGLLITFLAHQAWLMIDAIGRTLYRLVVSRRNLLEWTTAAQSQLASQLGVAGVYRRMSASVIVALLAVLVVAESGFRSLWVALPFVLLWIAAPAIARRISLSPEVAGRVPLSESDRRALRLTARRTWRYFETFVGPTDHMLPPDNFQEDPLPVVAHRTSPTNIGLYLLCAVSARDFGWTGTLESVERLEATFATLQRLQRFRGHFYNWYDTRDLRPLEPAYVSSVDSGNLAAHLVTVANACHEWLRVPIDTAAHFDGVADALHLAREALRKLPVEHRTQALTRQQIADALTGLSTVLAHDAQSADITTSLGKADAYATVLSDGARALASEHDDAAYQDLHFWAEAAQRSVRSWQRDLDAADDMDQHIASRLLAVAATAHTLALSMDFGFLLDEERKLLSIGYRVPDGIRDESCYDLLASEARLASFFAIAKNDVPTNHWFRLGRAVTPIGRGAALISWSGSMFEYLMPSLVMRAPAGSLLEQTTRLIVRRQMSYGASLGVPWGISESAYSARDLELTYQYSNFGVPGLGLKRGLSENVVIAPYATGLAAMVDPRAAVENYARLAGLGALGTHGFYEALDYTRARVPEGSDVVIVKAYMAHHQGMTVVAAANVLFDGRMRARFHADAMVQATELLLHERTPRDVSVAHPRAEEVKIAAHLDNQPLPTSRRLHTAHSATPQTHILSNGRYAVMLTGAGSGYSRWGDIGVTRSLEDATRDDSGSYVFVRDAASGAVWSAGYQPCGVEPDSYQVTFSEDRAEFVRVDSALTTTLEVVVSPEDNAEVRRVSL